MELKFMKSSTRVYIDGVMKDMSDIEYHILLLMMQHAGKIFSAQNLYESVAGTLFLLLQQHGNGTYPKTPGKIEDDPKKSLSI